MNPEKSIEKMDKFEPGIKGNEKIGADLKARTKKLVTETSKYDSYFTILLFDHSIVQQHRLIAEDSFFTFSTSFSNFFSFSDFENITRG